MLIERTISKEIQKRLLVENSKIIVIYGAMQVGKTTIVKNILQKLPEKKILSIVGDDFRYRDILSSMDLDKLKALVSGYDILFIDEAQRIENIGINLKLLHDNLPLLRIIVTGSSALDLANSIKEPLTGRTYTYKLYPISTLELRKTKNEFELGLDLEQRMIFGSYPEIFKMTGNQEKIEYLENLATDYLYKDVLELENIKYSNKLKDLLKLLALQVGSEVSYNELANNLELSRQTIASYIDLLEKAFVIIKLHAFSRNIRKEVIKKPKIYFLDLGVRNAIINSFSYFDSRNDIGALWENFLIIERLKRNGYLKHYCSTYFWRTYTGAELDYIEEYNGKLYGYEFKWSRKQLKAPKSWISEYKGEFECVNKDNFINFVCE